MSISAEIVKPEPTLVVHRWTLYEDGIPVGITRSATVVRAVRCHDEVVAALVDALSAIEELRDQRAMPDEKGDASDAALIDRIAHALAAARGEVAS